MDADCHNTLYRLNVQSLCDLVPQELRFPYNSFLKAWEVRFTSMFFVCIPSYKSFPVDSLRGWQGGSPKPHMLLLQRRCPTNTCWHILHAQEVLVLQHAGKPVPLGLQTLGPESLTARTTLFCSLPQSEVLYKMLYMGSYSYTIFLKVILSLVPS